MNTYIRHNKGFTLLELMISVGLGMVVVLIAVAGFRVASQTVNMSNRLSLENALIRAGINEAHIQLDFWTNLDDPTDEERQQLRAHVSASGGMADRLANFKLSAANVGLPFTPLSGVDGVFPANKPMKTSMPVSGSKIPRFPSSLGTPQAPIISPNGPPTSWVINADNDVGFDPTYAWSPHDPRTWFRGNCIEKYSPRTQPNAPQQWFGRYNIFTNFDQGTDLKYYTYGNLKKNTLSTETYSASYQATSTLPHRWYPRQIVGLVRALGFYGLCDYVPSNTIYQAYTSYINGSNTSNGGLPKYFTPGGGFINAGMMGVPSLGLYSVTHTSTWGVMNPNNRTVSDLELFHEHNRITASDYSLGGLYNKDGTPKPNVIRLRTFMTNNLGSDDLMELSPEHWPEVTVGVAHYLKSSKFTNLARVRWTSPMTGDMTELSFTGLGTSLRGARMQRHADSGWANWDNGPGAGRNDPHLDSP